MQISKFTNKIKLLPDFKYRKTAINNNTTEKYRLFHKGCEICRFSFTNYKGIDRYYSHGEIKDFTLNKFFRRKPLGIKAIFQAIELMKKSAKEKNIKFLMLTLDNSIKGNTKKLLTHLGAQEYVLEDLANSHFIYFTNSTFSKQIKRRLYEPVKIINQDMGIYK